MAKKHYHIPVKQAQHFFKTHRHVLQKSIDDPKLLEYRSLFGKSSFDHFMESYFRFFKIDKNPSAAIQHYHYFRSDAFIDPLVSMLGLEAVVSEKSHFYVFVWLFCERDPQQCEQWLHHAFLHYGAMQNSNSGIQIDYKAITEILARQLGIKVSESFGERGDGVFFRLIRDEEIAVELEGRSIKTLRKRAYKRFLALLLSDKSQ